MRIRRFLAKNYSQALARVKQELGEDALVMSTRSLEPGTGPGEMGGEPMVEITAAVEYSPKDEKPQWGGFGKDEGISVIKESELDLKSLIFTLLTRTDQARSLGLKRHQFDVYSRLVDNGVSERFASRLIEEACNETDGKNTNPAEEQKKITELMKRVLFCKGGIEVGGKRTKKVAFVGPTGAGKTTTIAKIAADFALRQKKKVAMVTLDTYRMGAVDQLRIYGEIMRIPVETASNRKELLDTVRKHSDKDLLLIDTMGRSPRDNAYSGQLKVMFRDLGEVETQLVLNVTAQEKFLQASFKQFSSLGVDRLLFTKLDEGMNFGALFNLSLRTRIPYSYFTAGQRVPEDIEVADKEKVIRLIFN